MSELNTKQIEQVKNALIEFDDYDFNEDGASFVGEDWDEFIERAVVTHEDAINFVNHSGRVVAKNDTVRKIEDYQYQKNDPRVTLYVIDLGDVRIVFEV